MPAPGRKWPGTEASAGAVGRGDLLGVWFLSQASQTLQGAWDSEKGTEDGHGRPWRGARRAKAFIVREGQAESQGLECRGGRPYPARP